jgi:putative heme iron utilization protein
MSAAEEHPDEIAAREAAREEDPAGDARRWLLETLAGTLCTTSVKRGLEGYPFGSVVPFALTPDGRPFIFTATIATHTANLRKDPRGSLFVRQPNLEGDPQKGWRITVMGRWQQIDRSDPDWEALHARYTERVPFADGYDQTHDFSYWRMEHVDKVRYIGGFGKICWIEGDEILRDPTLPGAQRAIDHMNEDHVENMLEMCRGLYDLAPEDARMTAVTRDGFLVRTRGPERLLYFPFGREVDGAGLRVAVVDVLRRARDAQSR